MKCLTRLKSGQLGIVCFCSFALLTAYTPASPAATPPLFAVSLPLTNPLEQMLSTFLQQFQTITTTVNQQLSEVLGPLQEDVSSAIETAFGPTSLDVQQADTNILNTVQQSTPSADGMNPVVAHQGTAESALTRTVVAANQSHQAQDATEQMLKDTQATLQQIKECAQTGQSAQATQDVLKSLLCQQQGIATMNASLIPLLQKNLDASTTVAANLKLLNEQLMGQTTAAWRSRQSEAAMKRAIYTQLNFMSSPSGTAVLKMPSPK